MTSRLVALRMPNGPDLVEALEHVWDQGDAALPLDPGLPEPLAERLLQSLRPHALAQPRPDGDGVSLRHLPDAAPVPPGLALVVPTSGSTGEPKGVELTHAALRAAVRASLDRLDCRPGDRWLLCLPLHHVAGILVLLRARALGVDPVVHRRFDPERVAQADADFVSLVPTQLGRILDAGLGEGLGTVLLGGAPPPPGLLERAASARVEVVTSYGLTETCGGCVYDGRALDPVEIELGVEGRITVRGPVLMRGYRGRPDLTREVLRNGRLLTPDRGRWTPDDRLEVLGRTDDVIVTGGHNVSAGAVGAVLADHPAVADVAVVGRPDPEWGEEVTAVMVPASDPPPDLEDLREFARDRLPAWALPRHVQTVERLPRDSMGKLAHDHLRALVTDD